MISLGKTLLSRNFCRKSVEKRKIWSHQKIFRQINSLVISLVKTLLSRNFCQKHTLWKLWNSSLTLFRQKFRESNGFTKQITKELIWRNFFQWERISRFSTPCVYFTKLLCYVSHFHEIFFSFLKKTALRVNFMIQYLVDFNFSKANCTFINSKYTNQIKLADI